MALFESYERRIDKINEVLNSYGISRSVLRMHAGLTSQVQRSQSRKTAETLLTQQQQSEKDFRHSVFRDLLLTSVK